ncbi:MAG: mandelate racemase/muconate lactonizing enzyme family protein [Acidimicrobiales bacterium]
MPTEARPATTIEAVEVYGYQLTYAHGRYVMSGGRVVTTLASTVVRVATAGGISGFGEVCPLGPTYLPGFAGGVRAAVAELAPALLGVDAADLGAVDRTMEGALAGHGYAKSALDVACWDVLGQVAGLPVATLLGGCLTPSFPLYSAVPLGDPTQMVAYVVARRSEGIHRFQLKVGGRPEDDARRVEAIVEATGGDDLLIADANGGWRQREALVAARLLERLPRLMLEQPCPTLDECLAVRRSTTLPVVLDEVITDVAALLGAQRHGAMDAVNLKISRVGGLTRARLVRDLAATLGLGITVEDTWGGDLTTAAVAHLATSTPTAALLNVSFMNDWTNEHVAGHQPRSEDGTGRAPTGPGLGVEVDLGSLGPPLLTAR